MSWIFGQKKATKDIKAYCQEESNTRRIEQIERVVIELSKSQRELAAKIELVWAAMNPPKPEQELVTQIKDINDKLSKLLTPESGK